MTGAGGAPDRERLGLCANCRHARRVPTPRAIYWRCALSETDPGFDKYPRLPVLRCDGHLPAEETPPGR